MSYEAELDTVVQEIVDAAIESTMAWLGLDGTVETGFRDKRYTVTPPDGNGGGGVVTDHLAEEDGPDLDDRGTGDIDVANDIYNPWQRAIPEVFADWRDLPQAADFDSAVDAMRRIISTLPHQTTSEGGGLDVGDGGMGFTLTNIAKAIGPFDGATIQAFDEGYVTRLSEAAMPGQHGIASVLGHWVTVEQQLWRETRAEVLGMAREVRGAMAAARPAEGGGGGWRALISVARVLTTAASVFAGPVVAGAATTFSLLDEFLPEDGGSTRPEARFDGVDPKEVYEKMTQGLDQLNRSVSGVEERMWDKLTAAHDLVLERHPLFDLRAPSGLISETDPTSILPSRTTASLEIRQRLDVLQKVGDVQMDHLATGLLSCATVCSDAMTPLAWSRPGTIGFGSDGAWPAWQRLADELRYLLEDTAQEVRAAGHHLAIAAAYMARTDDEVRGAMARTRARLARDAEGYEHRRPVAGPVGLEPGPTGGYNRPV